MSAGVTLEEARERFPTRRPTEGAMIAELRAAALAFGIETGGRRPTLNRDVEAFAFDAVRRGTPDGEAHWCVWDAKRRKRLDPYDGAEAYEWICRSYLKVTRRPR